MANYLLVYHGGGMAETDAARAESLAAWGAWFQKLGGAIVDAGNPVGRAVTLNGGGAATDGGGSNPATGYSVIKADSMDAATELARGCPILTDGGTIEVCETFNVM